MVIGEEIRKNGKSGIAMETKAMRMVIGMIAKILIGAKMNHVNAGRGQPEVATGSEEVGMSIETTIWITGMKIKEEKKEAKETREAAKVEKEEDSEEGQPIKNENAHTSIRRKREKRKAGNTSSVRSAAKTLYTMPLGNVATMLAVGIVY